MTAEDFDPVRFAQLVAAVTRDVPLSGDEFAELLRDRQNYAYATELDAIWQLVATLNPPAPSISS